VPTTWALAKFGGTQAYKLLHLFAKWLLVCGLLLVNQQTLIMGTMPVLMAINEIA
jgi:hypothetical protein